MKTFFLTAMTSALVLGGSAVYANDHEHSHADHKHDTKHEHSFRADASASVINNAGEKIGGIDLIQGPEGVLMNIDIHNLTPGAHGFHIHKVGNCDDHKHFKSASGHVTEEGDAHGLLNPQGPELGDLPNLIVPENGHVKIQLYADDLEIFPEDGEMEEETLLDADGSAFMIHEHPDDHKTQPIGGAGARIACGVIVGNNQ